MRAAARIVTGCPRSAPTQAVMAEARRAPMEELKKVLAVRLLGRALALPPSDPLRETAEASVPSRLSSVRGWWKLGRQMLAEAEITLPIEPVLPPASHRGSAEATSPSAWTWGHYEPVRQRRRRRGLPPVTSPPCRREQPGCGRTAPWRVASRTEALEQWLSGRTGRKRT